MGGRGPRHIDAHARSRAEELCVTIRNHRSAGLLQTTTGVHTAYIMKMADLEHAAPTWSLPGVPARAFVFRSASAAEASAAAALARAVFSAFSARAMRRFSFSVPA